MIELMHDRTNKLLCVPKGADQSAHLPSMISLGCIHVVHTVMTGQTRQCHMTMLIFESSLSAKHLLVLSRGGSYCSC